MSWYEVMFKDGQKYNIPAYGYEVEGATVTFYNSAGKRIRTLARGTWLQVRLIEEDK